MFNRALSAEKARTKEAREAAEQLAQALAEHKEHLQGLLLVLHVICEDAGGEIRIKEDVLASFAGKHPRVRQGFDTETKEWVFIAEDGEEPKQEENARLEGADAPISRETDNGVKLELSK